MHAALETISAAFRRFSQEETCGRSPLYEQLSLEISRDPFTLDFLSRLPSAKQQPNLLFGAVKYGFGVIETWKDFRTLLETCQERIRQIMLAHRTQTNEPARCATLLPLLAQLPQPLALLELGASAGLCLIPDRYRFVYNGAATVDPRVYFGVAPPVFSCRTNDATPIPKTNLQIVWRAGLDLEPIDSNDRDSVAWLEALVWPGEGKRLELLHHGLRMLRFDPPRVVRGDLRTDLQALAAQAPRDATLVIFNTAVFAYLSAEDRTALGETVAGINAVWISNESPAVSPCDVKGRCALCPAGNYLLVKDRRPIACTDRHGASIHWLSSTPP